MTILIIFLGTILLLLTWLLVIPVQLILDSDEKAFKIRFKSIVSVAILIKNQQPVIAIKSFFYSTEIPFSRLGGGEKKKVKTKKRKKKKFRLTRRKRKWLLRMFRIPRSFRVRYFNLNIDTGDYIINAYMYPMFSQVNYLKPNWNWNVNYLNHNQVYLLLQSSLIRMIYVVLK